MPWQDRLREAAYRSPNGNRFTFLYEDVSRVTEKKTPAFDFPDADGTLIQDLGRKGRRYPLRAFFSGDDHDLEADSFESALLERGAGVLEHPRYGQVDVVPLGEISQRDDLKTASNQTIVEVVFWETIGLTYPTNQTDGVSAALSAVSEYSKAATEALRDNVSLDTEVERVTFSDQWSSFVGGVNTALESVAKQEASVSRQFNLISDSINSSIDVLVDDPLTLASQTLALINAPAAAAAAIEARVSAYATLADSIITGSSNRLTNTSPEVTRLVQTTNDQRAANELRSRELFAQGAVSGSITATMTSAAEPEGPNGYATRSDAISAAEQLLNQLQDVTDWSDLNYRQVDQTDINSTPVVDTGAAYQKLQEAVALAAGALVTLAFDLPSERKITLTSDRSVFDLVAQYYGDIDSNLDFFINTNSLTGSDILELPRGKTVVVYV